MPSRLVAIVPSAALLLSPDPRQSSDYLIKLLQRTSGLVNQQPAAVHLPCEDVKPYEGPKLLTQCIPTSAWRAQLVALTPADTGKQPPNCYGAYTSAVLQHAAVLLLALLCDSLVLLVPETTLPESLLQLLPVLARVKQILQKQLQAQWQGSSHTSAAADQDATAAASAGLLRRLLQKQSVQLHVILQAAGADTLADQAAAAVQQAEQTLLQGKAAAVPAVNAAQKLAASRGHGADRRVSQAARRSTMSHSGDGSSMFQLASVQCCQAGHKGAQQTRRVVLRAIQQQLSASSHALSGPVQHAQQQTQTQPGHLNPSPPQQQQQQPTQQQPSVPPPIPQQQHKTTATSQLPAVEQLLASIAAAAAAQQCVIVQEDSGSNNVPVTATLLQQLWQHLLQQLFHNMITASSSSRGAEPAGPRFTLQWRLQPDDVAHHSYFNRDMSDNSGSDSRDDDANWDQVQHEGWDEVNHHGGLQSETSQDVAGEVLAAAVDPQYHTSAKKCYEAARAALRAYLQAIPERYSQAVHEAEVQQALRIYSTKAAGPALSDLRRQLEACCLAAWQSGRQQCNAFSLTGRPCTLSPHHEGRTPHDSGAAFQIGLPDSSKIVQVQDWFSLWDANVKLAAELQKQLQQQPLSGVQQQLHGCLHHVVALMSQQRQQQQHFGSANTITSASNSISNRGKDSLHGLSVHARHHDQGLAATGSSSVHEEQGSSSSKAQFVPRLVQLGPCSSSWVVGAGPAAYDAANGLSGDGWLHNQNQLLQLKVLAAISPNSKDKCSIHKPARSTSSGPFQAVAAAGRTAAKVGKTAVASSKPQKRGGGAVREQGTKTGSAWQAAVAPTTLGPEDFPTLAEAVGGTVKKVIASSVQQRSEPKGSADSAAAALHQITADAAKQAQQQLIAAWEQLGRQQQQQLRQSTDAHGIAATVFAVPAGAVDGRGSRGHNRAKGMAAGRHGDRAAAAGGKHAGLGSVEQVLSAAEASVLTTFWLGLEYESLSGTRCMLQPHQVMPTLHKQDAQQLQLQRQSEAPAAAAGQPATGRQSHSKGTMSNQQQHHWYQKQQQQQQQDATNRTAGHNGGVEWLLLQDIPLYVSPLVEEASTSANTGAAAAAAEWPSLDAPAVGVTTPVALDLQMLQLQRIHVRTPGAPFAFASQPKIVFHPAAADSRLGTSLQAHVAACTPTTTAQSAAVGPLPTMAGSTKVQTGVRGVQQGAHLAKSHVLDGLAGASIEFGMSRALQLPADSLVVINLPKVYVAPDSWVKAVHPAAANRAAAAAAVIAAGSDSSAAAPADSAAAATNETGGGSTHATAGAAAGNDCINSAPGDPAAANAAGPDSTEGETALDVSAAGAANSNIAAPVDAQVEQQQLLPLIPIAVEAAGQGQPAGSSGRSIECVQAGNWSAYLTAGSWLFPVAPAETGADEPN